MKKLLIVGVSDVVGGIETLFHGLFAQKNDVFDITFLSFDRPCAFAEEYLANGYKVDVVPSRRSNPFAFSANIKKYFKQHPDFDYVWVNTAGTSMYQLQLYAKKLTKTQVISHSHGTKFEYCGNPLFHFGNIVLNKLNYNKVINNTDLFFGCSRPAGIAVFGAQKENELIVINNGVNCDKFCFSEDFRKEIRAEFGVEDDALLVGFVGRLSEAKNPVRAVEIFKAVAEKMPASKLLVVGAGELFSAVQEKIAELNLDDTVILAGLRKDVHKIYSAFDVLIMPSLFEGFPLAAVEAQCSGLPCIFSGEITREVGISDLASFVDLNADDAEWAAAILNVPKDICRPVYCDLVKKKGYDYSEVEKKIESILI